MVEEARWSLYALVRVGDDIFEAKQRLEADGFRIEYGPGMPTKDKSYYMMIVGFGVDPAFFDTLGYVVTGGGDGEKDYG